MNHRNRRSRLIAARTTRVAEAAAFLDLLEDDLAALIDDLKEARLLIIALGALTPPDLVPVITRIETRIVALRRVQATT